MTTPTAIYFVSCASTSEPTGTAIWCCDGPAPAHKGERVPFVYLRRFSLPPGSTPEQAEEAGRAIATAAGFTPRQVRCTAPVGVREVVSL